MEHEKEFAIYAAEILQRQDFGDEYLEWFHSSLMLMDETPGRGHRADVVQELSYVHASGWRFYPVVFPGLRHGFDLDQFHLTRIAGGPAPAIMERWSHGLEFAVSVRARAPDFSTAFMDAVDEPNCRTGVRDTLAVMGFGHRADFAKAAAGLGASIRDSFPDFTPGRRQSPIPVLTLKLAPEIPALIK
jgi:hypothetical protein